jgi:hypothetical protein
LKYLFLSLILFLASCSLNKESADDKKLSKILEKTGDYRSMTFDEFNLFLKDYSKNAKYPDINQ